MVSKAQSRLKMKRAVSFSLLAALLIPLVGLISAPVLARSLGVEDRGDVAAATAPAALLQSIATFGLPAAVTYYIARRPSQLRSTSIRGLWLTAIFGSLTTVVFCLVAPVFSGGNSALIKPMIIANFFGLITLLVGVLSATAMGPQEWPPTVAERVLSGIYRLVLLIALFSLGRLNSYTAVMILASTSAFGGLAYIGIVRRIFYSGRVRSESELVERSEMVRYGMSAWSGSIAGILVGRMDQLLFVSVSSTYELGLYVVSVTISDVIYIMAGAASSGIFAVASASNGMPDVARYSRIATIGGCLVAVPVALATPLILCNLFGAEFVPATQVTWVLLGASVIQIPALVGGRLECARTPRAEKPRARDCRTHRPGPVLRTRAQVGRCGRRDRDARRGCCSVYSYRYATAVHSRYCDVVRSRRV